MMDQSVVYMVTMPGMLKGEVYLALGVQFEEGDLQFYDTTRGRCLTGTVEETEDGFKFTWKRPKRDDEEWTFKVLTVEDFNKKVRPAVENGKNIQKFMSDDDLHEWYRRRFINP